MFESTCFNMTYRQVRIRPKEKLRNIIISLIFFLKLNLTSKDFEYFFKIFVSMFTVKFIGDKFEMLVTYFFIFVINIYDESIFWRSDELFAGTGCSLYGSCTVWFGWRTLLMWDGKSTEKRLVTETLQKMQNRWYHSINASKSAGKQNANCRQHAKFSKLTIIWFSSILLHR